MGIPSAPSNDQTTIGGLPPAKTPVLICEKASLIIPTPVQWLWPGWIPLGTITVLDGDPGLGKSTVTTDLSARVSTHGLMPGGTQGAIGDVLIISAEDNPANTIVPRLKAAGANRHKVDILKYVKTHDAERLLEIPTDIPYLEAKLNELKPRLLIIDPLMAFLVKVDANKDQEIRRVLYKLSTIAEKYNCAIVLLRHLNKGGSTKAIYRGNSSIGVIGHARAGLLVAINPDNDPQRIIAVSKCNLSTKPKALTFALEPAPTDGCDVCRIAWIGPSNLIADELLEQPQTAEEKVAKQEQQTKQELCQDLLAELLLDGPKEIQQLKKECSQAGCSVSTTERAAKALGLLMAIVTNPDTGKNSYTWELPPNLNQNDDGPEGPPKSPCLPMT